MQHVFDTPIQITFNSLTGLGWHPVAPTCDCTLELPRTYTTYSDFATELAILTMDNEPGCLGWKMDTT